MTYTKKYGKGWYNESERHRLSRLGIKTGRKKVDLITTKQFKREYGYKPTMSDIVSEAYYRERQIPGEGPFQPYKISYSKIDYSMMSKLQSFIHKKFNRAVDKHPKHIQEHKDVVKARHDIEEVTSFDKFKGWLHKHRKTLTYIGLGGVLGITAAVSGLPTLMQNVHTGEIVAVGGTFIGKWGMVGQTVLTGMGVLEEAKVISKDTQKKLFKQTLVSPEQLKIEQKAIIFKVSPKKQVNMAREDDYGDLQDISSKPIPFSQLTEKEQKVLNTSISKVKSLLGKRGKTIRFNEKNLQVVKRVGPDNTAFGAHQGDLIQIDRDTLKDPDKTEGVLLHEAIHKIYGVRDETRELENLHIDYLGELM